MTDIQVGDLVICEKDNWKVIKALSNYPKVGQIFTVRAIDEKGEKTYLRFEEFINPPVEGTEPNYNLEAFRKITKPSIQIFKDILKDWQKKILD